MSNWDYALKDGLEIVAGEAEISIGLRTQEWDELLAILDEALDRSRSMEKDERLKDLRDSLLDQLAREVPPR